MSMVSAVYVNGCQRWFMFGAGVLSTRFDSLLGYPPLAEGTWPIRPGLSRSLLYGDSNGCHAGSIMFGGTCLGILLHQLTVMHHSDRGWWSACLVSLLLEHCIPLKKDGSQLTREYKHLCWRHCCSAHALRHRPCCCCLALPAAKPCAHLMHSVDPRLRSVDDIIAHSRPPTR